MAQSGRTRSANVERKLSCVVAHRGASANAPENTLGALQLAIDHGAKSVEVDAMISSDGVAYLHHDDTLNRCTSGSGYLCAAAASELDELDASGRHTTFAGEPIPRLDRAIALLVNNGIGLNLEIKPTPGLETETATAAVNALRGVWPHTLPLVLSSFSKEALYTAKQLWPEAPRGLITCALPVNWQDELNALACTNLHMAAPLVAPESAQQIKSEGYGLYCYTVNDVEQAQQLIGMGVDGIFTDRPKALLEGLSQE